MTNIALIIFEKLKRDHKGKEKAIKREDLLAFVKPYSPEIDDRDLRKIYASLPVVSGETGIFFPIRGEEVLDFKKYLNKRIMPQFERARMVLEYHSSLLPDKGKQLGLF